MIKENVSEKPKRGRPSVFSEQEESFFGSMGIAGDITTRRGKMNRWWAFQAFSVIGRAEHRERFGWLVDFPRIQSGGGARSRWTLLAELGRLADPDLILQVAGELCELKPTTVVGVAQIRQWRTGRSSKPDALKLSNQIIAVINIYKTTHPETTHRQMMQAIETVAEAVAAAVPGKGE